LEQDIISPGDEAIETQRSCHKKPGPLLKNGINSEPAHKSSFIIMKQCLAHVSIVVKDYDEATAFYTEKLHFSLLKDTVLSPTKRRVLVEPKGASDCSLLLVKGTTEQQENRIGNQTGGRFFCFSAPMILKEIIKIC
jgi:hypothetical protein